MPILICANKCDLSGERAVSSESGQALARSLNPDQNDKKINYIETSGKTCFTFDQIKYFDFYYYYTIIIN